MERGHQCRLTVGCLTTGVGHSQLVDRNVGVQSAKGPRTDSYPSDRVRDAVPGWTADQDDDRFFRRDLFPAQLLKAVCDVHHVADDRVVDPPWRADVTDDNVTGVYADADSNGR